MVKETSKVLERTLPETIDIITEIARDVPNVEADPTQMQQVLMNLCVNARDGMPEGGTLTIGLFTCDMGDGKPGSGTTVSVSGKAVCLSVTDTGVGIPPEVQERIFEPFFTTKAAGKGTGLGLSTVHGIVQTHGGTIQLESRIGEGATFSVRLPAIETEAEEPVSAGEAPSGNETLLLVEDDENVREIAEKMLRGRGYEVVAVCSGEEALSVYEEKVEDIDLVITDLILPGLDGRAMAERLKTIRPELRVLYMSGYERKERTTGGQLDNGVGFLAKPFDLSQLSIAVRDGLNADLQT